MNIPLNSFTHLNHSICERTAHVKWNWNKQYEEGLLHFTMNHSAKKQQIDVNNNQSLCVVKCVTIFYFN